MSLFERYNLWKQKRYWKASQFEHLRIMIQSDARWLAHDPIARALTERYEAALREDWYKLQFTDSDKLRRELKLEPKYT